MTAFLFFVETDCLRSSEFRSQYKKKNLSSACQVNKSKWQLAGRALSHSVAFFTTYPLSSYSLVPYYFVLHCFRYLSCRFLHFFSLITQCFPPYASTWVQGVLCAIVSRHSTTSILTYNIFML